MEGTVENYCHSVFWFYCIPGPQLGVLFEGVGTYVKLFLFPLTFAELYFVFMLLKLPGCSCDLMGFTHHFKIYYFTVRVSVVMILLLPQWLNFNFFGLVFPLEMT